MDAAAQLWASPGHDSPGYTEIPCPHWSCLCEPGCLVRILIPVQSRDFCGLRGTGLIPWHWTVAELPAPAVHQALPGNSKEMQSPLPLSQPSARCHSAESSPWPMCIFFPRGQAPMALGLIWNNFLNSHPGVRLTATKPASIASIAEQLWGVGSWLPPQ